MGQDQAQLEGTVGDISVGSSTSEGGSSDDSGSGRSEGGEHRGNMQMNPVALRKRKELASLSLLHRHEC
jgi:hypothetical protein